MEKGKKSFDFDRMTSLVWMLLIGPFRKIQGLSLLWDDGGATAAMAATAAKVTAAAA